MECVKIIISLCLYDYEGYICEVAEVIVVKIYTNVILICIYIR